MTRPLAGTRRAIVALAMCSACWAVSVVQIFERIA
jgi:hypothetical protein